MTGIHRTGMVVFMVEKSMEYGHGLILEEYGIGKIFWTRQGSIQIH